MTLSPCYAMTPKYRTEAHRVVNVADGPRQRPNRLPRNPQAA